MDTEKSDSQTKPTNRMKAAPEKLLVHWRGEDVEGYSLAFRHPEFLGALTAVTHQSFDEETSPIHFENALNYDGEAYMSPVKLNAFNKAMQWITLSDDDGAFDRNDFSLEVFIAAASRCSLIHTVYEVVAVGDTYSDLNDNALSSGGFQDVMRGGDNEKDSWAVRVRHFGDEAGSKKERRHGGTTRSVSMEKEALLALKPMLLKFGGGVDLRNPDCKIYVFDGLVKKKALAREIATGPQIFSMAPATRICITTTPLEPIASFTLCNIAGLSSNQKVLDPYSGSCAILLAAAMLSPTCQTVGIDIAHDGLINRDHIGEDFATRNLTQPKAVFRGDFNEADVRDLARAAVGGGPFDHIITDPPYGIRERKRAGEPSSLEELFFAIQSDRERGVPLLRKGGRLVCFVPCRPEIDLADVLPSREQAEAAGMKLLFSIEQPLNSKLSRWLVSYQCLR